MSFHLSRTAPFATDDDDPRALAVHDGAFGASWRPLHLNNHDFKITMLQEQQIPLYRSRATAIGCANPPVQPGAYPDGGDVNVIAS